MGKLFRWLLMAAAAGGRRFALIKAGIGSAVRARAKVVPVADAEALGATGTATAADPIKVPIADGNAKQGVLLGVLARGECFRLVLAQLRAGLGAAFRATAAAVPTVTAAFGEIWGAAVRAAAESVPTTDVAAVPAGQGVALRADPEAVPTVLPASAGRGGLTVTAQPTTAAAEEATVTRLTGTRMHAKPGTWFEPVVVDGVLVIKQARAEVVDGVLEVE